MFGPLKNTFPAWQPWNPILVLSTTVIKKKTLPVWQPWNLILVLSTTVIKEKDISCLATLESYTSTLSNTVIKKKTFPAWQPWNLMYTVYQVTTARATTCSPGTVMGECARYSAQAAPVPCPKRVTLSGSPPNAPAFSLTHCSAAIWSIRP